MSEVEFELKPLEEKPHRRYRKGSKYDPILDEFIEMEDELVKVEVKGKEANYLKTQLNKRIVARELESIKVSVVNNNVYLGKKA